AHRLSLHEHTHQGPLHQGSTTLGHRLTCLVTQAKGLLFLLKTTRLMHSIHHQSKVQPPMVTQRMQDAIPRLDTMHPLHTGLLDLLSKYTLPTSLIRPAMRLRPRPTRDTRTTPINHSIHTITLKDSIITTAAAAATLDPTHSTIGRR
ncbi:hypothetical protein BGZ72_005634, partial [Mortierella alpina]